MYCGTINLVAATHLHGSGANSVNGEQDSERTPGCGALHDPEPFNAIILHGKKTGGKKALENGDYAIILVEHNVEPLFTRPV